MKTGLGQFIQDKSGLWHYQHDAGIGSLASAAANAIEFRPPGAAWFWFNGTPGPLEATDTVGSLAARWDKWRDEWQKNPTMLALVTEHAGVFR